MPPAAVPIPEIGTLSWRAVARRARIPAAVLAVVVAAALIAGGPARTFLDALRRAAESDPRWVAAAVAFEALSFAGYVALLWHVAGRATPRFGLRESYRTALGGAAVTRLLPTAGAGGAALTLWTLQRAGHRGRAGVRTLLTFLVLLYAVFLGAITVSGALSAVAPGAAGAALVGAIPAAAAAMAIAIAIALGAWRPAGAPRGRLTTAATVLGEAVRDALALVRGADPRLLGAPAWWAFDVAVLWAMFHAVGAPPAIEVLVLGYFLGQVANTIPVPGAASGGLVGVLLAFGVQADLALAAVFAYRAAAIWLPAPAGLHALAGLRRSFAQWAREDATGAIAARPLRPAPLPRAVPVPARPLAEPVAA